ncbi:aromatic ring-hydroxylating oxygenase subunit alpha [Haliea atlantica]
MSQRFDLNTESRTLRRRLVRTMQQGLSELGPQPLVTNTSLYTDPERHAAEHEFVFRHTPLVVGLSRDVPEPGNTLLFDAYGPPVIVVRQEDGGLAAFRNFCPHRGGQLQASRSKQGGLLCPFHGWRFDQKGHLTHRPLGEAFDQTRKTSLEPVAVAERHGLLFIQHETTEDELDLRGFLGGIDRLLEAFQLDRAEPVGHDTLEVEANWKLVVDISCEGYHVPATHPKSLSPQLVPFLTIHDHFGLHHRFASPGRDLQRLVDLRECEWPPSGTDYSAVHYLFPNTILTVSAAIDGELPVIAINRSFPTRDIGVTRVVYSSYRPMDAPPVPASAYAKLHAAIVNINRDEDLPTVAGAWRNYASLREPASLVFGRNEMLLQRYHGDIAYACGIPLPITAA